MTEFRESCLSRWAVGLGAVCLAVVVAASPAVATSLAPPMLDITRQCDSGRRNASAMSECIVAESEARSAILQKWDKISDENAERCLKANRKVKRFAYSAMAKCLSVDALAPSAGLEPSH